MDLKWSDLLWKVIYWYQPSETIHFMARNDCSLSFSYRFCVEPLRTMYSWVIRLISEIDKGEPPFSNSKMYIDSSYSFYQFLLLVTDPVCYWLAPFYSLFIHCPAMAVQCRHGHTTCFGRLTDCNLFRYHWYCSYHVTWVQWCSSSFPYIISHLIWKNKFIKMKKLHLGGNTGQTEAGRTKILFFILLKKLKRKTCLSHIKTCFD